MSGSIHVYGQWSSFRIIKGKSPGKQIFPCRRSNLHDSSYVVPVLSFPSCHISIPTPMLLLLQFLSSYSDHVPKRWDTSSAFQKVMLSPTQKKCLTCLSQWPQNWLLLPVHRHCGVTEFPWATNQEREILHFADISNMVTFNNIASFHSLFKVLYPSLGRKTCS